MLFYIYHIIHNDIVKYVGSTKDINSRWKHHLSTARMKSGQHWLPLYVYMRENGIEFFQCIIVKQIDGTKLDARIEEQMNIDLYPFVLNIKKAYNELSMTDYNKLYQSENKEHISVMRKLDYQNKKNNPEWVIKERERKKLDIRRRRALIKANPIEYEIYKKKDRIAHQNKKNKNNVV